MKTNHTSLSKFYWVVAIFALPIIASWLLYYFHQHITFKTMNHGELITPAINAEKLLSTAAPAKPLWRIIHIDNGQCDSDCQQLNFQLNQVRKVLGKDQTRLLVMPLNLHSESAQIIQQAFNKKAGTEANITDKIYLMDPLGNIFMVYSATAKPMDILKDLKRVLEVSQIG